VIDKALPRTQQQLEFQANVGASITWSINGKALSPTDDGRFVWPLEEGEWTVEAANEKVRTTRRFAVRGD
jgi:hypothetical protein